MPLIETKPPSQNCHGLFALGPRVEILRFFDTSHKRVDKIDIYSRPVEILVENRHITAIRRYNRHVSGICR